MILAVIPARFQSSRFPGKPLADIGGRSMILRVCGQVQQAQRIGQICVATDDLRIFRHVRAGGFEAVMTRPDHASGTERAAEAAAAVPEAEWILNVQGDEPFIDPAHLDLLCSTLQQPGTEIASLMEPIRRPEDLHSPHVVKVLSNAEGNALYFSRSPIPYVREAAPEAWLSRAAFFRHVGVYGFRRDVLLRIPALSPAPAEQAESLEQLRWLHHGLRIRMACLPAGSESPAVDTPEDWKRLTGQSLPQFWGLGGPEPGPFRAVD